MIDIIKKNLISISVLVLCLFSTVAYATITSPVYKDASNQLVGVTLTGEYGGMHIESGGVYTINTQNAWHAYIGFSIHSSPSANVVFNSSILDTDISAYSTSDSGTRTKVTTTSTHGLSLGDIITITNTTNYNDIYEVMEVVDTTNFTIDKAWDTNDDAQGTFARGSNFEIDGGGSADGLYMVTVTAGGSSTAADTYNFAIACEKNIEHFVPRKFPVNDVGSWAVASLCDLSSGDHVWFAVENTTGTTNIDIDEIQFILQKL